MGMDNRCLSIAFPFVGMVREGVLGLFTAVIETDLEGVLGLISFTPGSFSDMEEDGDGVFGLQPDGLDADLSVFDVGNLACIDDDSD